MHNAIRPLTGASICVQSHLPCRNISGRRYLLSRRNFQTTHLRKDNTQAINDGPGGSAGGANSISSVKSEDTESVIDWTKFERALDQGKTLLNDADKYWPGITAISGKIIPQTLRESWRQNADNKNGSENRRSWRNRTSRHSREEDISYIPKQARWLPEEIKRFSSGIPRWFLERNIELHTDMPDVTDLVCVDYDDLTGGKVDDGGKTTKDKRTSGVNGKEEPLLFVEDVNSPQVFDAPISSEVGTARYRIKHELFSEIEALARAGLKSATSMKQEDASVSRPHLILQSPKAGGNLFLSCVARKVAKSLGADYIQLDPTTISELIVDSGIELPERLSDSLKLLGYDAYHLDEDLEIQEEEEYDLDDSRDEPVDFKSFQSVVDSVLRRGNTSSSNSPGKASYKFNVLVPKLIGTSGSSDAFSGSWAESVPILKDSQKDNADKDLQYRMLMDQFLDSTFSKSPSDKTKNQSVAEVRRPLVLLIEDYLELQTTKAGGIVLDKIHELVQDRRIMGQEILIIGLSSSEDLFPATTVEGWQKMENIPNQNTCRTIITIPSFAGYHSVFEQDERNRTRLLNIRNFQDMLRRLAWNKEVLGDWCWQQASQLNEATFVDVSKPQASPFERTVWSAHRLNRVATLALGLITEERPRVDEELAAEALNMSIDSDVDKFNFFLAHEKLFTQKQTDAAVDLKPDGQNTVSKVRKNANSHEKRLLHGVIDKKDIKTKFSSVHAPESTIKSLKTLTSLSLHRPDAFGYGVLANDKIPGLLLYGPPGTGKTLLAKAVAGESGATVLEVSGSDIYDMYVGEGEKNVRAIFTLAEKLSPCVVFIDEADAILGSRSTPGNRTTHRELINQFLREWDGLSSKNSSAFIMVATNRPFDLDDAVLRRLPRRLLVDLPTEKDRETILKIHLADEKLDESISVESLAQRTPFYSGSDLKNVCVAAALQAVQEEYDAKITFENEQANKATPEAHSYPPIRTLTQAHFEKALADISASISEDMSSLTAIRKFDEKYGDHRGRKPKGGLGFGMRSTADTERERREDGRVRREVLVNV